MTIAEQLKLKARYEGKLEGKLEGILQTAKNMLAKGFDVHTIKEVTGLSDAELTKLSAAH